MPEPLPRGANFRRTKFLWEIGLDVAGDPTTPYGGDRDMCISIGNGSGEAWRPAMRMGTGSPILALDVARGLVYLHARRIIHCDLKSPNILLDR